MSDRSYKNKNTELLVKFFRRDIGLYPYVTGKSIKLNCNQYMRPRYDFFFDKLNLDDQMRRALPKQLQLGWKITNDDMKTHGGYEWGWGKWHVPTTSFQTIFNGFGTEGECPAYPGDGLCLAKTWTGATSGNVYPTPGVKVLLIAYHNDHVLHDTHSEKYRVRACYVAAVDTLANYVKWLDEQGYTAAKLGEFDKKLAYLFDFVRGRAVMAA